MKLTFHRTFLHCGTNKGLSPPFLSHIGEAASVVETPEMENNGYADDQSSGWRPVKRRHRINSRTPMQNVSTTPSFKPAGNRCSKVEDDRGKERVSVSASEPKPPDPTVLDTGSVEYLDKQVVQNTSLEQNSKPNHEVYGGAHPKSCAAGGCLVESGNEKLVGSAIENEMRMERSEDIEEVFPDCSNEETLVGNWKEVGEIPSASGIDGIPVECYVGTKKETGKLSGCGRVDCGPTETCILLDVGRSIKLAPPLLENKPDCTLNVSEVVVNEGKTNPINIGDKKESKKLDSSSRETVHISLSSANDMQYMSGMLDHAECESKESKERFRQRLWCFLFENLNRAVDELYLLCELECDMEQIEEAILVLKESISDFTELKSRIEGFNFTKKSISLSANEGLLVNMKMEPCRPHALSWEVRRMTTSPHKAEILSSSLEAFRKMQMERVTSHTTLVTEVTGSSYQISSNLSNCADENASGKILKVGSEIYSHVSGKNDGTKNVKDNDELIFERLHSGDNNVWVMDVACSGKDNAMVDSKRSEDPRQQSSQNEGQSVKDKVLPMCVIEKQSKMYLVKRDTLFLERDKEREKKVPGSWKCMDAWKEKRNWEAILKSPSRSLSKVSHSPSVGRKNVERTRTLHDKLMSPEKKKRTASDVKKEVDDKHARAMRIRNQLEIEKMQRLQKTSEKLNRVNEWQAVRNLKLKEGMHARHQRGESRHEAYLAQVVKRAGDESSKVNEVRFITSLNEENKKLMLRQKLHDSEIRRAERLQALRSKQREDMAKEEAASERRKTLEAEKLQRLAETQRKKEEAQMRREEERKASSAAREARAVEQLRRKEVRAKAQEEEAELLAQKLAEKLHESEQRRKFYLEQIREKASMDFREQASPLLRRSLYKDGQGRLAPNDEVLTCNSDPNNSLSCSMNVPQNQILKRRIKKIRQKLMSLKYAFIEPSFVLENAGHGNRSLMGMAKVKIGRWLQDLQKHSQARKEGYASIGLITGELIKFLEGKEAELHASRQAGLVDFLASALPASHNSKPGACQVTTYFLCLLRVVLSLPTNRDYFISQNLLPPIIPMLSSSLENYIKIAASLNLHGNMVLLPAKVSSDSMKSVTEILEGFLWTVMAIIRHNPLTEKQLQMRDGLIELVVSYEIIHRLRDLFALHNRPQIEASPFPSVILSSLDLLEGLTFEAQPRSTDVKYCLPHQESMIPNLENTSRRTSAFLEEKQLVASNKEERGPSAVTIEGTAGDIPEADLNTETEALNKDPTEEPCKASSPLVCRSGDAISSGRACPTGNPKVASMKHPAAFLIAAMTETGLVNLPSLLTAILLQANNKVSTELNSCVLPTNFEEVAVGVLKVLNNLALLDITFLQNMLGQTDLKMELFHLMSFLLSHCISKWKVASDQVGILLMESLSLLGCFAFLHTENQAVLRWGKGPTILHKLCDLPFGFFSDPELMPILGGMLVAACYGNEQNRRLVQQELSMDMLLSLLKSCHQDLLPVQPCSLLLENGIATDTFGSNRISPETKKSQGDLSRLIRRNAKTSFGKGVPCVNSRSNKSKILKDSKGPNICLNCEFKQKKPTSCALHYLLYTRFSASFLDKLEEFFSRATEYNDG